MGEVSFHTQSIQARCKNIEVPISMVAPRKIPLSQAGEEPPLPAVEKAESINARAVFQEAVITLMNCLAARVADAIQIRRKIPANFSAAHEPAGLVLHHLQKLLAGYNELVQHEKCPAEEKASFVVDREKYELMVRVQEFVVSQTKRAHALLHELKD